MNLFTTQSSAQAMASLTGQGVADGLWQKIVESGGGKSDLRLPNRRYFNIFTSSLPMMHDLVERGILANCRVRVEAISQAIGKSRPDQTIAAVASTVIYHVFLYPKQFTRGFARPQPCSDEEVESLQGGMIHSFETENGCAFRCCMQNGEIRTLVDPMKKIAHKYEANGKVLTQLAQLIFQACELEHPQLPSRKLPAHAFQQLGSAEIRLLDGTVRGLL